MTVEHFDAVVVGSGFGGSVLAYRLAEAGRSVCVLERGKPYPPGSFPRSPRALAKAFWDPSEGLYGMFNLWSFRGIGALVSSGLGGGSLIYANVLLRKDERWFVQEDLANGGHEHWPVGRADLEPHYDRAERMLDAQRYPFDRPPFDGTPKTAAFKEAAEKLGREWLLPPLAVTFANDGEPAAVGEPIREEHPNLHGVRRYTCRLVGECDIGCNFGSKNTLDLTYLSAAERHGAEIRTRREVRSFAPREGGGYVVRYVEHDPADEGRKVDTHDASERPVREVTCERLVLAAGTLGSTYLLLRCRGSFPGLSARLGTRFGGNGDLLTFALGARRPDGSPRVIEAGYGPVITSAIRVPDALDGGEGRGLYVEDAGYPEFVSWLVHATQGPGALWRWRRAAVRIVLSLLRREPEVDLSAEVSELLSDTRLSAGSLPLLGMGRDIPDGRMSLRGGKLDVDWVKGKSGPFFDRLRGVSEEIAGALGARFRENPTWHLGRLITVHPLGGCPLGRSPEEGVVDPYGEVFGHPGFTIADGSVMPGPVGPNPSLTIAALADRFADRATGEA
ncbi:MAG TPA: GMC family oxidoreductase [Gaiellaceae bacterium]|nr:GMC family oxidoreductase [Gaiellaceae bacterium]